MKPWKITWGAQSWTNEDVRAMHLAAVSELTGDTWASVDPWAGPRALMAWLAVLLAPAMGLDAAVTFVNLQDIPAIIGCLSDPPDEPSAGVPAMVAA